MRMTDSSLRTFLLSIASESCSIANHELPVSGLLALFGLIQYRVSSERPESRRKLRRVVVVALLGNPRLIYSSEGNLD